MVAGVASRGRRVTIRSGAVTGRSTLMSTRERRPPSYQLYADPRLVPDERDARGPRHRAARSRAPRAPGTARRASRRPTAGGRPATSTRRSQAARRSATEPGARQQRVDRRDGGVELGVVVAPRREAHAPLDVARGTAAARRRAPRACASSATSWAVSQSRRSGASTSAATRSRSAATSSRSRRGDRSCSMSTRALRSAGPK